VAAVGSTAVIEGQTDSTLTTLDPVRMRVVRTASSPVVPFVLLGSGTGLFIGSIADNAVVRVDPSGRVAARTDVPRFLGVVGVDRSTVTAGTYGDIPTVVALRRGDLGMVTTTPAPDTVDVLAGAGSETRAAFTEKRAVVSLL
jgi:predicted membrane GTPase involved in stress response